jgi:hypothetical protein
MVNQEAKSIVRTGTWWGKAIASSIVAGLAIACYEMIATAFADGGFWDPLNRIDAGFDGNRSPAPGFDINASTLGLLLHMAVSAFWGLVLAAIIGFFPRLLSGPFVSTLTGIGFGLFVALLMWQEIGPRWDEVLFPASALHFLLAHMAYGLLTAWMLYAWGRKRELSLPKGHFPFSKHSRLRPRPS